MEKHVITLEIEKESDLYCPFNHEYELNDDVIEYLIRKTKEKSKDEDLLLRICSKEALCEECVRDSIDRWIKNVEKQ